MPARRRKPASAIVVLAAAAALLAPADAIAVSITAFKVEGRALDLVQGQDGSVWAALDLADSSPGRLARLDAGGEVVEQIALPVAPDTIAWGPDGNVWVAAHDAGQILRVATDGSGRVATFAPTSPTPIAPYDIAAGPDGKLWFSEPDNERISRMTTAGALDGQFGVSPAPYDIAPGPDGNLWFTEAGTTIGRITPQGTVAAFPTWGNTSPIGMIPTGIVTGPDDHIWFGQGGSLGRLAIDGAFTDHPIPSDSSVGNVAAGPDGHVWYTTGGARGRIGRMSPDGAAKEWVPGGRVRPTGYPRSIIAGPGGTLWYTDFDFGENRGEIGRVSLEPPVATTAEATGISHERAELRASVDPNDYPTTYRFEYGTSADYGASTADAGAGDGADPAAVSSGPLAGLAPSTTYHYRVVATNAMGTVHGPDRTFATAPAPPLALKADGTLRFTGGRPKATTITRGGRTYVVITVAGTVRLPFGVNPQMACRGQVIATVSSARKALVARNIKLNSKCAYKRSIRFRRSKLRVRRVVVRLRFPGNAYLRGEDLKATIRIRKQF